MVRTKLHTSETGYVIVDHYLPLDVEDSVSVIVDFINAAVCYDVNKIAEAPTYSAAGQWVLDNMWKLQIVEDTGTVVVKRHTGMNWLTYMFHAI